MEKCIFRNNHAQIGKNSFKFYLLTHSFIHSVNPSLKEKEVFQPPVHSPSGCNSKGRTVQATARSWGLHPRGVRSWLGQLLLSQARRQDASHKHNHNSTRDATAGGSLIPGPQHWPWFCRLWKLHARKNVLEICDINIKWHIWDVLLHKRTKKRDEANVEKTCWIWTPGISSLLHCFIFFYMFENFIEFINN